MKTLLLLDRNKLLVFDNNLDTVTVNTTGNTTGNTAGNTIGANGSLKYLLSYYKWWIIMNDITSK